MVIVFCAEYQAHLKLVWERCPWNVRRSSKPFLNGRPPFGRVCYISNLYSWSICLVSLGRPSWTSLELGEFCDLSCTISCPFGHWPSKETYALNLFSFYFPWTSAFVSTMKCATCHCPIGDKLCRFMFSRSMPCVISWLVVSFQVLRSTAYK